jgi:hypothetical protein
MGYVVLLGVDGVVEQHEDGENQGGNEDKVIVT